MALLHTKILLTKTNFRSYVSNFHWRFNPRPASRRSLFTVVVPNLSTS